MPAFPSYFTPPYDLRGIAYRLLAAISDFRGCAAIASESDNWLALSQAQYVLEWPTCTPNDLHKAYVLSVSKKHLDGAHVVGFRPLKPFDALSPIDVAELHLIIAVVNAIKDSFLISDLWISCDR